MKGDFRERCRLYKQFYPEPMRRLIDESDSEELEKGFAICEETKRLNLFITETVTGTEARVEPPECPESSEEFGHFHTHPKDGYYPSITDFAFDFDSRFLVSFLGTCIERIALEVICSIDVITCVAYNKEQPDYENIRERALELHDEYDRAHRAGLSWKGLKQLIVRFNEYINELERKGAISIQYFPEGLDSARRALVEIEERLARKLRVEQYKNTQEAVHALDQVYDSHAELYELGEELSDLVGVRDLLDSVKKLIDEFWAGISVLRKRVSELPPSIAELEKDYARYTREHKHDMARYLGMVILEARSKYPILSPIVKGAIDKLEEKGYLKAISLPALFRGGKR